MFSISQRNHEICNRGISFFVYFVPPTRSSNEAFLVQCFRNEHNNTNQPADDTVFSYFANILDSGQYRYFPRNSRCLQISLDFLAILHDCVNYLLTAFDCDYRKYCVCRYMYILTIVLSNYLRVYMYTRVRIHVIVAKCC